MTKHILIIGGMGPQASVHAHRRLIELSQLDGMVADNESYPRVTHLSINVKDFISESKNTEAAEKYILDCLKDVNFESVDAGFIACNTAHLLYDSIQKATGNKLMSMIEVTRAHLNDNDKIGIVATPSTIRRHLYGDKITVQPDQTGLDNVESIIRKVISGVPVEELVPLLREEIAKLRRLGADKIVLGCSELSMFSRYLDPEIIIDPIDLTIHELMKG